MKLQNELRSLEAGLAGYMLRVACNDSFNDELLSRLSKCIERAELLDEVLEALKRINSNKVNCNPLLRVRTRELIARIEEGEGI